MANADLIDRIRELHRPVWYDPYSRSGQVWLVCHGCDEGSHAETPAGWPCRTADIVYTGAEIAAREPEVAECHEDHGVTGSGTPVRPQAVFVRIPAVNGQLMARRWACDHVQPVPVESADPWK